MAERKEDWLPIDFVERMKIDLGDEYDAFLASYDETRVAGLRQNLLKHKEANPSFLERMPFALTAVPWCETGYYYNEEERPGKHALHEAGAYYIQEPSAMSVAEMAAPKPGEYVLDLCAAPGGKTTQLAAKMQGEGLLVANEIIPSRAKILSQNVERMGIVNSVVLNHAPEQLVSHFPSFFDCIVVDAPCSGEGMFRKNHEACEEWSLDHVTMCASRQAMILEQAAAMLAPGGRIIYSTCTFSKEENEGQMAHFLELHPEFELEQMEHIFPHKLKGEGHFAARLQKKGASIGHFESFAGNSFKGKTTGKGGKQKGKAEDGLLEYDSFLKETMKEEALPSRMKGTLKWFGDQLYLVPLGMISFDGLKTERPGLHLGTRKKGRFEPAHALAMALEASEVKQSMEVASDTREIAGYLQGMTLDTEVKKGWTLVTTDGYSIGWGKATNGTLKNHYPKGLYKNVQ